MTDILTIKNLTVKAGDTVILKDFNLIIKAGEVHAIMGPNGSGKSTLSKVLMGDETYSVIAGSISYLGQDLLSMSADARAHAGLFLGFQYPVAIAGVNNMVFLKTALNAKRKALGLDECDSMSFMALAKQSAKKIDMNIDFLKRDLNDGFSGGEKKRNEILQMLLLEPKMAILDEIDSGLDIDALQSVACGINALQDKHRGFLLITHYPRLLELVKPDFVHVMVDGDIVQSGDYSLALKLEESGYATIGTSNG